MPPARRLIPSGKLVASPMPPSGLPHTPVAIATSGVAGSRTVETLRDDDEEHLVACASRWSAKIRGVGNTAWFLCIAGGALAGAFLSWQEGARIGPNAGSGAMFGAMIGMPLTILVSAATRGTVLGLLYQEARSLGFGPRPSRIIALACGRGLAELVDKEDDRPGRVRARLRVLRPTDAGPGPHAVEGRG
jgi:hypothetical protein